MILSLFKKDRPEKKTIIPKNIFQSWYTRDLSWSLRRKIDSMKNMNPYYKHKIFTDEEIDTFVEENYPGEVFSCYSKLKIIVVKVDFWRYLTLYKLGGVYLDFDSSIEKPLDNLIGESDEAIITAEGNPNLFVQWALIFRAGHPILERTIDLIVENIKKNRFPNDIHQMTGPSVYSRAIYEVHKENFSELLVHADINKSTDKTFPGKDFSYRLYGVDYGAYFRFKHSKSHLLDKAKKHWRVEQNERNLLD